MVLLTLWVTTVAAVAGAISVPQDISDGVYMAYINSLGHEIHKRISEKPSNFERRNVMPAPEWTINPVSNIEWQYKNAICRCDCDSMMFNEADTAAATAELYDKVIDNDRPHTKMKQGDVIYSVRGDSLVYLCNEGYNSSYPNGRWIKDGVAYIAELCGNNIPAWWNDGRIPGWRWGRENRRYAPTSEICRIDSRYEHETCDRSAQCPVEAYTNICPDIEL